MLPVMDYQTRIKRLVGAYHERLRNQDIPHEEWDCSCWEDAIFAARHLGLKSLLDTNEERRVPTVLCHR